LDIICGKVHQVLGIGKVGFLLLHTIWLLSIINKLDILKSTVLVETLDRVHPVVHRLALRLLRVHLLRRHQFHKSLGAHRARHLVQLADWARRRHRGLEADVALELLRAQRAVVPVRAVVRAVAVSFLLGAAVDEFFVVSEVTLGGIGAGSRCLCITKMN